MLHRVLAALEKPVVEISERFLCAKCLKTPDAKGKGWKGGK